MIFLFHTVICRAHSLFSERRLICRSSNAPQEHFDYIQNLNNELANAPDRYYYREGVDRSARSQAVLEDLNQRVQAIDRMQHTVDFHTKNQDERMREAAVREQKYATAMARAAGRKQRLGLPYIGTGARIQMERAQAELGRQAPKLFALDQIDNELFDQRVTAQASYATEERYPSAFEGYDAPRDSGRRGGRRLSQEEYSDSRERDSMQSLLPAIAKLITLIAGLTTRIESLEQRLLGGAQAEATSKSPEEPGRTAPPATERVPAAEETAVASAEREEQIPQKTKDAITRFVKRFKRDDPQETSSSGIDDALQDVQTFRTLSKAYALASPSQRALMLQELNSQMRELHINGYLAKDVEDGLHLRRTT